MQWNVYHTIEITEKIHNQYDVLKCVSFTRSKI